MEDKGQKLYEWYIDAQSRLTDIYSFVTFSAWGELSRREQDAWRLLAERVQSEEL